MSTWETERSFHWGILLLMDRDARDVPSLTNDVVSHSASGVAVKVRHAADVELSSVAADDVIPPAQVHVEVRVGEGPPTDPVFSGLIDVPSGVVTIGDADQDEALTVGPGRWEVQVECAPREDAESVGIWLQAVPARS